MLRIAWASRSATLSTFMLGRDLRRVQRHRVGQDDLVYRGVLAAARPPAHSARRGWRRRTSAWLSVFRSAWTVLTSVPAVSIMSSQMMTFRPPTWPMTCMTSASFGAVRRLSTTARSALSRLAKARARSTPPASGETIVRSGSFELLEVLDQHRCRIQVIDGNVEEALDLTGVQVHRQDPVRALRP